MTCGRLFDRRVRRAVKALEDAGCRARAKDGGHVILLPPGDGPTLKISASRPPEETLHFLRTQFAEPNGLEGIV
jgi:hypothetical protein